MDNHNRMRNVYVLSLSVGGTNLRKRWLEREGLSTGGRVRGRSPEWSAHIRSMLHSDTRSRSLVRASMVTMILAFLGLSVSGLRSEVGTVGRTMFVALEVTALVLNVASTIRIKRQLRHDLEQ